MTATTMTPSLDDVRLSFGGVLRSEWIKLRTLRSTVWCFALIALLTVGFGLLLALTFSWPSDVPPPVSAQEQTLVQVATLGVNFTQLIAAVLGVLVIGGEYSTGMIRSTFTAAPGRMSAYFAKAIVIGISTFVVGAVSIGITAVIGVPILAGKGFDVSLAETAVLLPLLGGAGYLALVAVFAFSLGAILRNTAGGIAAIVGLVLVLPIVLNIVSAITQATWLRNVMAFLPSEAGGKIFAYNDGSAPVAPEMDTGGLVTLDTWQGLVVLLAWVALGLVLGAVLTKRRDA